MEEELVGKTKVNYLVRYVKYLKFHRVYLATATKVSLHTLSSYKLVNLNKGETSIQAVIQFYAFGISGFSL